MKRKQSFLRAPLLISGAAVLGYAGVRALLDLQPGADVDFFRWTGPTAKGIDVGSAKVDLPILYYRDDAFMGVFTAAREPVQALLPSCQLYPVLASAERAMLVVIAFNYFETSVGPYGEIGIVIPCTYGRQAPPWLPLALESKYPGWGGFVLHLPVTSRVAHDAGRGIWGYTKFVSDMDFAKRPAYQRVRLAEGDSHILTLTVQQSGLTLKDNRPLITYSVLNGQLIKTVVPSRSVYQLALTPGAGKLELGDHEIADELRRLDVSATSIATKNYLTRYGILPAGDAIGAADRPHTGHATQDRSLGRLTVNYDDAGETIDLYARWRS